MDWSNIISAFIGAALGSLGAAWLTLRQSRADRLADAYADLAGATTALIQSAAAAVFRHQHFQEQWTAYGRCHARLILQEKRKALRQQAEHLRGALDWLHSVDMPAQGVDPDSDEHRSLQGTNLLDRHAAVEKALEKLLEMAVEGS